MCVTSPVPLYIGHALAFSILRHARTMYLCVSYDSHNAQCMQIISPRNINRLVFLIETWCVYCEVGTAVLCIIYLNLGFHYRAVTHDYSSVSHHRGPGSIQVVQSDICGGQVTLGQGILLVFRFSPLSIIPPMLHNHLYIVLPDVQASEVWEHSKNPWYLRNRGTLDRKILLRFLPLPQQGLRCRFFVWWLGANKE